MVKRVALAPVVLVFSLFAGPAPAKSPQPGSVLLSSDDLVIAVRCSTYALVGSARALGADLQGATGMVTIKHALKANTELGAGFKLPFNVLEFGPSGKMASTTSGTVSADYDINVKPQNPLPPVCNGAKIRGIDANRNRVTLPATLFTAKDIQAFANAKNLKPTSIEIGQTFSVAKTAGATFKVDLKIFNANLTPKEVTDTTESGYALKIILKCVGGPNSLGFIHECRKSGT